jgi:hypothetical protein
MVLLKLVFAGKQFAVLLLFVFRTGNVNNEHSKNTEKARSITQTSQGNLLFERRTGYCYFTTLILSMKKTIAVVCLAMLLFSCKKAIQNKQEDLIIKAMTSGQWTVTSFSQNGSDITGNFNGYKFQYYSNRTVDAIKNGALEKTGTWDGDGPTMTTWANFTNATTPLSLINGSWHIDNNSWTFVVATQTTGSETKTMRLDKQ